MLVLLTLTALLGAEPAASPAEVAAQEAKHLKNIRQVTSGFSKAGEGYFRPDGKAIIFQAAKPGEDDYQIYTLDLAPGAKPVMVSTGQGQVHVQLLSPGRQVDPVRLDPPRPGAHRGRARRGPSRPRSRPTAGASDIAGTSTRPWTSSGPISTGRTSSA